MASRAVTLAGKPTSHRQAEQRADALAHLASAVLLVDAGGAVTFANDQACRLLGCDPAPNLALGELFARCGAMSAADLLQQGDPTCRGQIRLSDGRIVKVEGRALSDGGAAITLDDISVFVRDAERALADPLTGLTNRLGLHGELARLLDGGREFALFALDLDRFKSVNDSLGHPVGDALLRKVGERLMGLVSGEDIVARVGGDEFIIVKVAHIEHAQVEALAARAVDLIGRTYALEGHMLNVGASVGIALAPADGTNAHHLLKQADLALYAAKAEGRGRYRFFEPEMDARMQARRTLELDLRRALALKEFALEYQPQIDLETRELVGFEALLRWRSATRGTVSPAAFIPVAEEIGLIVPIGEWALRTACHAAAAWSRPHSIAVNLSPLQFRGASLVATVVSALAGSGLEPHRLELEITEGALIDDTEGVVATLNQLRGLGVRVSMDDFGTGYSSLSYLQKFPFDKIKIDQSFVQEMSCNAEAAAIVRAVARLGASLGMTTTAEGVETEEQLAAIRAEGCSQVQGYLTGRPMSADAAAALVAAKPSRTK